MFSRLAIDLGTAKTIIADESHGILCKEPSLVSFHKRTRQPLAVGLAAARLLGRTPQSIIVSRPLKAGRVHDFEAAALMLKTFLDQLDLKPPKVQLVVGIPLGLCAAEKLALRNLFRDLDVRSVHLVEEPIASAAYERMNLMNECAGVIIDVGAGLTELALLGSGTILASRSLGWSGDHLQQEIEQILLRRYALRPSRDMVESIRKKLLQGDPKPWIYRGFHMQLKKVLDVTLDPQDFLGLIDAFCEAVHRALMDIVAQAGLDPHDARLFDGGLTLTGSAFPLAILCHCLETRTGLPVHISDQPDESVVHGLRSMLSYADYF